MDGKCARFSPCDAGYASGLYCLPYPRSRGVQTTNGCEFSPSSSWPPLQETLRLQSDWLDGTVQMCGASGKD